MLLQDLNFTKSKLNTLSSHGINTVEDLLYSFPKKYKYFDTIWNLTDIEKLKTIMYLKKPYVYATKEEIALVGNLIRIEKSFENNRSSIKMRIKEKVSGQIIYINVFGQYNLFSYYQEMLNSDVIVGGILQYQCPPTGFKGFSLNALSLMSENIEGNKRIIPVYRKYKGISDKFYEEALRAAIRAYRSNPLFVPAVLYEKTRYDNLGNLLYSIHFPKSRDEIKEAERQIRFERLLYFQGCLKSNSQIIPSDIDIKSDKIMNDFITSLPYELTEDQKKAITVLKNKFDEKKCVSALIQGDVGCGKTIIAASLMILMAENGYQSVLMAPTLILAKQHYEQIKEYGEKYGFKTSYLGADLSAKQKKEVLKDIASGDSLLIVGTHSCFGKTVEYKKLGLSITDEEHKFGVAQRAKIKEKNVNNNTHTISMSATPIPRTIACSLYGNELEVITVKSLPKGRLPIQTSIFEKDQTRDIMNIIYRELQKGNQAYVVCPLIDKAEDDSIMAGIPSIEEISRIYKNVFETKLGYKVEIITGKTDKHEMEEAKKRFQNNESQILIATTVIEVGVNVPNATVIAITGADRFGLATSHQLRGRVGRGNKQSYCLLQRSSDTKESVNLDILCSETDGYEIAKEDLKNRGTGNLLGTEQSGKNSFIDMLIEYPQMNAFCTKLVERKYNEDPSLITDYIENYERRFTV